MKTLLIAIVLVVLGGAFYFVHLKTSSTLKSYSKAAQNTLSPSSHKQTAQVSSGVFGLPKPPLSCSTNVSSIPLTIDYEINAMPCSPAGVSNVQSVLSCNGTILQGASNVSINCSLANGSIGSPQAVCSGTTNVASSPTNLTLNYSCYSTNSLSHAVIYVCSGDIAGFSSAGISLPLTVNCSS